MVNLDINLLPRKGAREILAQRWFKRLKKGSFIFLGVYGFLLLAVFGVRFFFSKTKANMLDQETEIKSKIDSLVVVESQQVLAKSKLKLAYGVLVGRKSWYDLLSQVMEFLSDEQVVSEVILSKDGDLRLSVRTARLQELAVMLNALVQIGVQQDFVKDVTLDEVKKDIDGTYGFTLVFET